MSRSLLIPIVLIGLSAAACREKERPAAPRTFPTSRPAPSAPPASMPAETEPTRPTQAEISPQTRAILARLEAAGRRHPAVRADLDCEIVYRKLGDRERRTGWIAYQQQGPERAACSRVHFDTLQQDEDRRVRDEVDYVLKGRWLTIAKHRVKQITRYEVVPEGRPVDLFKLGKGPFPLPFGQRADEVIRLFHPTSRAVREGPFQGMDYVRLVPRPAYRERMSFTRLEMWVDRKRGLPTRIVSRDQSQNVTTVVFRNIRTSQSLPAELFEVPRKPGWTYREQPLPGR